MPDAKLGQRIMLNIGRDVSVLPMMEPDAKPRIVLRDESPIVVSRISPDSHWIAYSTLESTGYQIYVRPFSPDGAPSAKYMISKGNAAFSPRWRGDSKRLFYLSLNSELMAVDIDTSKGFEARPPQLLFANLGVVPMPTSSVWDVAPDGKRFLFVVPQQRKGTAPFSVMLNWQSALKK